MNDWQGILQSAATIFALVNPAVCAGMLLAETKGLTVAQRRGKAISAVLAITVILVIAIFAGTAILNAFGISFPAFSVAGGAILGVIGVQMMLSDKSDDNDADAEGSQSITPLIVFAASPGTITGVITIASVGAAGALPIEALGGVAVVMLVLLLIFLAVSGIEQKEDSKPGLGRRLMTNYMGLIVIAMGVQFMLQGWHDFMS